MNQDLCDQIRNVWKRLRCLVLLLVLSSHKVSAQTQWRGILDENWSDPALWTEGVPDGKTNAVIEGPFRRPELSGNGKTADLIVGRSLVGNLTVLNGGILASGKGYIGFQPTASGEVALTGGATWQLDDLYVGGTSTVNGGIGTLIVDGGSLVEVQGTLKLWEDGHVLLNNANGSVSGTLAMAGGTLTMENNAAAFVNAVELTGDNRIQLNNASLTVAEDFDTLGFVDLDLSGGFFGTSNFRVTDADLTLNGGGTWSNTGEIRLGHRYLDNDEEPELRIDDYQISSGDVVVGDERTALVFFQEGTWDAANFTIGRDADAGVLVGKFGAGPQLNLSGNLSLGALRGANGNLDVRFQSGVIVDGQLEVGGNGVGDIRISEDATVQTGGTVWIGRESDLSNVIEIDDRGKLTAGGDLVVGDGGQGILRVESGPGGAASVTSQSVFIGLQASSLGEVSLSGESATLLSNGIFSVGTSGVGSLDIENGANLAGGSSSIGTLSGSFGAVRITGVSSRWLMTGLDVGRSGDGTLIVSDGAQVGSTNANVAVNPGSTGVVTVRGSGSGWTVGNDLYFGGDDSETGGDATLRIEAGGVVTADRTFILAGGLLTGSDGLLESNVFNAGEVSPGASPGVLTVDGAFATLPGGRVLLEVDGLEPGLGYDQLIVTETLDLEGGSVVVDFSEYGDLALGDFFEFFPNQDLTGQLLNVVTLGMDPSLKLDFESLAATGTFVVVPEASTILLVLLSISLPLLPGRLDRRRGCRSVSCG